MIRNPYSFLNTNQLRRPHFPVPEDIFASDDQVAERHEQEVRSPAIDRAIDDWNAAKEQGDESSLRAAAKSIVDATSAAFKLQGVPTFAHPVLPPQFVKAEVAGLGGLSSDHRGTVVNALLNMFDPSAKPGAIQQFAAVQADPYSAPQPLYPPVDPRSKPEILVPKGAKATRVQSGTPFLPHESYWELFGKWAQQQLNRVTGGPPPSHRPPPGVPQGSDLTWDQEFALRARRGAQMQSTNRFPEYAQGSERQSLVGALQQGNKQRFGNQDQYVQLAPKSPHPEDPYANRTAWPVRPDPATGKVTVTSPMGKRKLTSATDPEFHPGVDFRNPIGEPVFSPRNGTILRIEPNSRGGGNQVFILLDDGTIVGFSHTLWMDGLQEGDEIYAGQQVGESDGSGTTQPHTHMSVYPPGTPIDEIVAPPVFKGHSPSERYYAARKPPYNPDDHKLDDPAGGRYYKKLQINPFAPGQFYGDRRQGADFLAPRAVR